MTYRLRHTADTAPSPCIEHVNGRFLHREFPVMARRGKRNCAHCNTGVMMMDGKNKAVPKRRLHLSVSQKTYDTVSAIATARETTKAEILRELLNDGVRYQQSKAGQPA